ncbi:ABC transporter ATP-binding protein [Paraburkholderia caballeronis]|uniref:ABC transporter ATP-binding protein n=1 Tax=Paraburkholderia caballeronis TaxID=416943 RepID=UPI00313997F7
MNYLEIENLTKSFGTLPVLCDVSLSISKGELFALLGPSGGGKSTLLRIICGFERPDRGSVSIEGVSVEGITYVPPERRHIGYVPQESALFPHLTVAENIAYGLDRAARRSRKRVDELLGVVGLPAAYAQRSPQELSGGQQQRVALARALAPRPALIMLDEPFSALDTALRAEMRQTVATALEAERATAILVTHDQPEALSLGDRVAVLIHGKIAQVDTPRALYANPADAELASFVGEAVFLPGVAADGVVDCELGRLPLAGVDVPAGQVQAMIRPERIRVARPGTNGAVPAIAEQIAFFGHDANVDVRLHATGRRVRLRLSGGIFHISANRFCCLLRARSSPIRVTDCFHQASIFHSPLFQISLNNLSSNRSGQSILRMIFTPAGMALPCGL